MFLRDPAHSSGVGSISFSIDFITAKIQTFLKVTAFLWVSTIFCIVDNGSFVYINLKYKHKNLSYETHSSYNVKHSGKRIVQH